MSARFEFQLADIDRRELQGSVNRTGFSASAIVRFGMKWALSRLDVLASGGTDKTHRAIAQLLDEMRKDPRLTPLIPDCETSLAALDFEGDGNPNAAGLYDMIGIVAAEPIPLAERLRLIGQILDFEGTFTVRRMSVPVHTP